MFGIDIKCSKKIKSEFHQLLMSPFPFQIKKKSNNFHLADLYYLHPVNLLHRLMLTTYKKYEHQQKRRTKNFPICPYFQFCEQLLLFFFLFFPPFHSHLIFISRAIKLLDGHSHSSIWFYYHQTIRKKGTRDNKNRCRNAI